MFTHLGSPARSRLDLESQPEKVGSHCCSLCLYQSGYEEIFVQISAYSLFSYPYPHLHSANLHSRRHSGYEDTSVQNFNCIFSHPDPHHKSTCPMSLRVWRNPHVQNINSIPPLFYAFNIRIRTRDRVFPLCIRLRMHSNTIIKCIYVLIWITAIKIWKYLHSYLIISYI